MIFSEAFSFFLISFTLNFMNSRWKVVFSLIFPKFKLSYNPDQKLFYFPPIWKMLIQSLCLGGKKKIKKLNISILSTFFTCMPYVYFFPIFKMILYSLRFSNTLLNIFPPQLKLTLGFLRKAKWVKCVVNPLCLKSGHRKIWVCYITPFCHQLLLCNLPLGL